MRIAIIGAGLAGLACAHELERLGLEADIFEQRMRVGKMFRTVETMLRPMLIHPPEDIQEHLRTGLNLPVFCSAAVRSIVIHSRSHEVNLVGHLGYTTVRGNHERALEVQLARHVRSQIHFGSDPDLQELRRQYDVVFVAPGSPVWSKRLGVWERRNGWWVRGANVVGDFDPGRLEFFFNTRYAGTGYAMISPFDERHASVGVGVPDTTEADLERYWEVFRAEHSHRWEAEAEQFKTENYEVGHVPKRFIDNVVLIGGGAGFSEPLGLTGQVASLCSGVFAARKLVLGTPEFDRFAHRWDAYMRNIWRIRRNVNAWTDDDMDRFTQFAGSLPGRTLLHSPWNLLAPAGKLMQFLPLADDASTVPGPE